MEPKRLTTFIGILALVAVACAAPAVTTRPSTPAATATAQATPAPITPAPITPAPITPEPPVTAPPPTEPPVATTCEGETINFELSFIPNVQHAGFLLAAENGYYEDEGMTVNILPAAPGTDVTQDTADGTADLGQVDYVDIVEARVAGVPIKAVAQIYKDPFFFWYANADSGIDTVADWQGHTLGAIQVGDYPERDAMMLGVGLDPATDITVLEQTFGTETFIAGDVEIGEGVVFYHPAYLIGVDGKNFPDDFNVFYPADNGADFASQTLAANETYIAEHPAAIGCFIRASIRGWRDAFDDTTAAVDATMVYVPEGAIPRPHQEGAIHSVLPIVGSGSDDLTLMQPTPDEYQFTVDQLVSLGYLEATVDIAETYDGSFWDAAMQGLTAP